MLPRVILSLSDAGFRSPVRVILNRISFASCGRDLSGNFSNSYPLRPWPESKRTPMVAEGSEVLPVTVKVAAGYQGLEK